MKPNLDLFLETFPSLDSTFYDSIDFDSIPKSVATIMDGNGRWAQERGLERADGHKAGVKSVKEAIITCNNMGVECLTIYSFSTENWKRPKSEVSTLMKLFADNMQIELLPLMEQNIKIVFL
ncbi:MAG: polyprenyl diphosphate synthase, partial [Coriobacteriales bacterium]|nr:polyprenyl diphosphate synthase [Coriobacteriales bacterium]